MASTVWKGHITFGLLSIPIKLTAAARSQPIEFHQLRRSDQSRLGQKLCAKADGCEVDSSQIVKGYEYEKGRYVQVTDEELRQAAPKTSTTVSLLGSIALSEIDPIYYESSYYVAPEDAGVKAYSLLYFALSEAKLCVIGKIAMHKREHVVVIRAGSAGLIMHTLFYQDEVRSHPNGNRVEPQLDPREAPLALDLVNAIRTSFNPHQFRDEYRANILTLIESKKSGAAPGAIQPKVQAPMDLTDAITATIAMVKQQTRKAAAKVPGKSRQVLAPAN